MVTFDKSPSPSGPEEYSGRGVGGRYFHVRQLNPFAVCAAASPPSAAGVSGNGGGGGGGMRWKVFPPSPPSARL